MEVYMKKIIIPAALFSAIISSLLLTPTLPHKENSVQIKAVDYVKIKNEMSVNMDENKAVYKHNLEKEMDIEKTILLDDEEIEEYYKLLKAKEGRQVFSQSIEKEPVITYMVQNEQQSAVALDWWDAARYLYKVGTIAKVTDVETGKSFNIIRTGGINHADNEPLNLEDTLLMKDVVGEWGWHIRPVILEFDGNRLAASMYWTPHGYQTRKDNGFEGHFCIHFVNSTHHYSGKINEDHQNAIKLAEGK